MALVGALAQGDPVLLLWVLAVISVITRGDPLFLLREMALMGVLTCGDPGRCFRPAFQRAAHLGAAFIRRLWFSFPKSPTLDAVFIRRTHAVGDFGISTSSPCVFLLECMRLAFMAFQHILCVPPTKTHTLGVHGTPTSSLVVPLPEHMRLASLVYQRPLHVCPLLQRMRLAFMASAAYQIEIVLRQCVNGLKANWQEARLYRRMRKAVLREWSRLAQVGDMHKLRW
eukprot:1157862-Pelagomonas_calceolata.AAC.15